MTQLATKEQILRSSGYSYSFDRELYVNRSQRKAFSIEFIEDHSEKEIEQAIQEPTKDEWRFFFVEDPSPAVQRELAKLLG